MKNLSVLWALLLFIIPFTTAQEISRSQTSTKAVAVDVDGPVMYTEPSSDEQKKLELGEEIEKNSTVTVFPDAHVHLTVGGQLFTLYKPGAHDLEKLIDAGELDFVSGFGRDRDRDAIGIDIDDMDNKEDDTGNDTSSDDEAGEMGNEDPSDDTGKKMSDDDNKGSSESEKMDDGADSDGSSFDAEFFQSDFIKSIFDAGAVGFAAPGASGWGKNDCLTPALPDGSLVARHENTFVWDSGDSKGPFRFEIRDASDNKPVFMALTRDDQISVDLSSLDVKDEKDYYWQIKVDKEKSNCSEKISFKVVPASKSYKVVKELTTGKGYEKDNELVKTLKKAKAYEDAGFYYDADKVYRTEGSRFNNSIVKSMQNRNSGRKGKASISPKKSISDK